MWCAIKLVKPRGRCLSLWKRGLLQGWHHWPRQRCFMKRYIDTILIKPTKGVKLKQTAGTNSEKWFTSIGPASLHSFPFSSRIDCSDYFFFNDRIFFRPHRCVSFGQAQTRRSHSGAHQKRIKQACRDLLEEVVSAKVIVCDPTFIRPNCWKNFAFFRLNPLQK